METVYLNEDLWPGVLGNFLISLSFISALLSAFAYFKSANSGIENSWRLIGRRSFQIHGISSIAAIVLLFGLLVSHQFEYYYVWYHSSKILPFRYMFSSFWEGQEGSFMLWMFWNVILGLILIRTSKQWESPVMVFFAISQAFIASMLLGVSFDGFQLGSTPFMLLREHPDMAGSPFLTNESYLETIDGRGLNPLLQNYWMTIHPPTLFLGFASTLVPFAFAMAALWKRSWNEWLKPALPWAFFSVMILGTGILMGGAWAYEALSFGGFWAWDPVENSSLVPWLVMVGAAHVMLIRKSKGGSLFTAFFLAILSFLLILYSTFLTRSGVLGDTSVHAFVAKDQDWHLLSILLLLLFWGGYLLISRRKQMPSDEKEESLSSREFWMFIGALVLLISAVQITVYTSIPVYNKIFGTDIAPPNDAIAVYNSWQIPFAIVVGLLLAVGQYFNYRKTEPAKFFRRISLSFLISLGITALIAFFYSMSKPILILLLFASVFGFTANIDYMLRIFKGRIRFSGASIAHAGFAFILLGSVISNSQKNIISENKSGIDVSGMGGDITNQENIMLMKGDTVPMDNYLVTYTGKYKEGVHFYFKVEYHEMKENKLQHAFTLEPIVQINPRMGNVAEPDTRHFLHKDIYTHITATDMALLKDSINPEEYGDEQEYKAHIGDTLTLSGSRLLITDVTTVMDKSKFGISDSIPAAAAKLTVLKRKSENIESEAIFAIKDNNIVPIPAEIDEAGLRVIFTRIDPETGELTLRISEKLGAVADFIVLKAIEFPWINILWIGCILLIIGTVIALRQRIKQK